MMMDMPPAAPAAQIPETTDRPALARPSAGAQLPCPVRMAETGALLNRAKAYAEQMTRAYEAGDGVAVARAALMADRLIDAAKSKHQDALKGLEATLARVRYG